MPAGKTVKKNRKSIMPMVQDVVGALMPGAMGAGIARGISKGRLGSSNPVTPSMPRDPDTYPKPSRPASSVPGISSREEPDYPTSAPSFSKRPQARPKPMKPRARPARIEQEAAEAAAVERGNNEARRRASDTQNFSGGGMVRGHKSGQMSGKGFSGTY